MTTASKAASSRLPVVVGAEHVLTDPQTLSVYAVDGRVPSVAVRPRSSDEVVEIVKYAASEKLALIPSGARTKLGIGLPPRRYDIALDMSQLDRIIAYDPGDLTLSIEAGVPLHKVEATLAEHRQFVPLFVPYFEQATVGGSLATGVDSPLRQFYGTGRDYVLGMEFVHGNGVHSKSGGNVVKNVTGYDLHKLMIGALGTLGVITRVNFKTFPFSGGSHGFLAAFDCCERASSMRNRIAQSALRPLTLEILSPRISELFLRPENTRAGEAAPPPDALSTRHWMLATAYVGNEKVLARYESDLRRLAAECGAANVSVLGDDTRPSVWGRLREALPILLDASPATTIIKIGILPSRMQEVIVKAAKMADANHLHWAAIARGLGVIYFALLPTERSQASQREVAAATSEILAAASTLGANVTIPWGPSEWKATLKIWGPGRNDFAQMQKVKKVFDPLGVFSPGRFIGGI